MDAFVLNVSLRCNRFTAYACYSRPASYSFFFLYPWQSVAYGITLGWSVMVVRDANHKDVSGSLTSEEEIWALFRELEKSSDEQHKTAARERIWQVAERRSVRHDGDNLNQPGHHIACAERLPD